MNGRKDPTRQDWILRCIDCGEQFTFSVEEQDFFQSKELSTPKRCKPCRKVRRQSIVPDRAVSNE